ncbi:MAG TPA: hypothetical protein PLP31_08710 [Thermoanaerobaculaceae bacterium]|nr:hypothetical protein [Thermoanaerobaculaceae bacterium]
MKCSPSPASRPASPDPNGAERDDDWQCDDDLASLPGCLHTRKTVQPMRSEGGGGELAPEQT